MSILPDLSQPWLEEFDAIRNFHDDEAHEQIRQLIGHTDFSQQLARIAEKTRSLPQDQSEIASEAFVAQLESVTRIQDFQVLEARFLSLALSRMLAKLTCSGIDQLQPDQSYLFLSNHRDIVLDPMIINWALIQANKDTVYCAIGDNLLASETSKKLAQLNKCFAVLRSVKSPRAMVAAMRVQSAYIRHIKHNLNSSVWIAQREGRSKDNTDRTNPALLKMLSLAKPKEMDTADYIKSLHIVPVSLSYEWDPCDIQKAQQCLASKTGDYQKTGLQDLESIELGLTGNKGLIQCTFDVNFNQTISPDINMNDLAAEIDRAIHRQYRLFPVNIVAWQQINPTESSQLLHSTAVRNACSHELNPDILHEARTSLSLRLNQHNEILRQQVIRAYAQPVSNLLSAAGEH